MADTKPSKTATGRARRTTTPARLFKQVRSYVNDKGMDAEAVSVEDLLESLKEAALEELIADM